MDNALKDLIVIELASVLAGPSVGMFFAELGATVIKIENPATGGDVTRSWKLPRESADTDISAYFASANWGKKSIALDAGDEQAYQIMLRLIKKADIAIVSFKPGDAQRLKLDYDTLSAANQRLIYGEINGYGSDDPRVGYDAIVQAASGFTYMNGQPEGPPTKMPVALVDVLAAHQLKEALLVALLQRSVSGKGRAVSVSLIQAGVAALANQASNYLMSGHVPQRMGSDHPNIVPYGSVFTTSDGHEIVVGIGSNRQFGRFCKILGIPELADDPKFSENKQRVAHRAELLEILAGKVRQWPREHLLQQMQAAFIPAGGILTMDDVFRQPAAAQMILSTELSTGHEIKGVRTTAFGKKTDAVSAPPAFNQHVDEILTAFLQFNEDDILRLRQDGSII